MALCNLIYLFINYDFLNIKFILFAALGKKINRKRGINGKANAASRNGCLNGGFRRNER